ncbi:hypothetical protein BgiBS90_010464, partial [Biomphalaria glabrata]
NALGEDGAAKEKIVLPRRRWCCQGEDGAAKEKMELPRRRWCCQGEDGAAKEKMVLPAQSRSYCYNSNVERRDE